MNATKLLTNFFFRHLKLHRNYGTDVYEPDYLESLKPPIPQHNPLNVQLRGYDYPILENYQKLLHKTANNMGIDVSDSWGVPPQDLQIATFKPNSEIVNSQYKLKEYERTIQIVDVSSIQLAVFLRLIKCSIPAGVTVNVVNHEEFHDEIRYVPDKELLDLKQQLDELGGPSTKKK